MAMKRSDPDYYALVLGNSVLGGGFYSARLSIDLRKNAGESASNLALAARPKILSVCRASFSQSAPSAAHNRLKSAFTSFSASVYGGFCSVANSVLENT